MIRSEIIGVDEVIRGLENVSKEVQEGVNVQMKTSAARVLADSKRTLSKEGKHVTGKAINSGKILVKPKEVRVEYDAGYAKYIEFGRRAGKRPPLQPLEDWVKKKGIESDPKKIKGVAFVVARKIGNVGIKKSPFLRPAFERERIKFKNNLKNLIK